MSEILRTENLGIDFGGLRALDSFSMTIIDNEIVGLIGPNGAGKTTVFNLLTSVYKPTRGKINFAGTNIAKTTSQVTRSGVARTFQNIRLFKTMSVVDNVKVAMNNSMKYTTASAVLRLPSFWKEETRVDEQAHELLSVFDLDELADTPAGSLPYGAQRKLEIARALATHPKLLLLDEPAAGMNDTETADLMRTIYFIRENYDVSILLIEHDMNLVMEICDRIVVLDYGIVIASGTPDEIRRDEKVIEAYLGQ